MIHIESISIRGLLSFGWEPVELGLKGLNLLIGPNGSGKSNLLAIFDLLRAAPSHLSRVISAGGGPREWIHKGPGGDGLGLIDIALTSNNKLPALRYRLGLQAEEARMTVASEELLTRDPPPGTEVPAILAYTFGGEGSIKQADATSSEEDAVMGRYRWREVDPRRPGETLLARYGDPDVHPPLYQVGSFLSLIGLHQGFAFGPEAPVRRPQPADLRGDMLEPNARNLGHVLSRLRRDPVVRERLREELGRLFDSAKDLEIAIEAGQVQILLMEEHYGTPASRLSDGTLKWLMLLALLLDPRPPPILCIEEPELGLHPDLISSLGRLLREAAERTQLIVTTHSDLLVSEFTDEPEAVVVCGRPFGATTLKRLERAPLEHWLKEYSLGHTWLSGEFGGTRW